MKGAKPSSSKAGRAPLEALLESLIQPGLIFFPIRHHSPACSAYLEALIRDWKPTSILVEGPTEMTKLIPLLLAARTKPPFAIYTSFEHAADPNGIGRNRSAAYYPFADYSPELVALRIGATLGAKSKFIDLNYADQVSASEREPRNNQTDSLLEERYFRRSEYLQALARRAGCRDHNDLWDHLFETRLPLESAALNRAEIEQFIHDVAAWCYFSRADTTPEQLEEDGTLAREAFMASAIRREKTDRVLVVTGGFHTVVLPALLKGRGSRPALRETSQVSGTTCLVRYSFDQLDNLNGYSAGMPSPFLYQQYWRASASSDQKRESFRSIAARILIEIGQLTRGKNLVGALSTADEIAALAQAETMARLRGHPGPMREDILDAIRSCFVKGAIDAEGELLLGIARQIMAGNAIGEVPPEAGVPPLVQDFQTRCAELRLNIADSVKRKTSLDLYRKRTHRQVSRFFYSLNFLEVPFARSVGGPDFMTGANLDRLHEHWEYQWTPRTESQLIEANIHGVTIEKAAGQLLRKRIACLHEQGRSRNAAEAVTILVQACRMGLHEQTPDLLQHIRAQIAQDPDFPQLVGAVEQLLLLWQSREPLEAHRLPAIPTLIKEAHQRVCFLIPNLASASAESAQKSFPALLRYRDLALHSGDTSDDALVDLELFWEAVSTLLTRPATPPVLAGVATGLVHWAGRMPQEELLLRIRGYLNGALTQSSSQTAFLAGLLKASRELAWSEPALIGEIENLFVSWSDDEFIQRLPDLRLAFADLTPHETDRVAALVAQEHGQSSLGSLRSWQMTEDEMLSLISAEAAVRKGLEADGLLDWVLGTKNAEVAL